MHPNVRRAVGYCRVSSREQGESGLGLAAQAEAIRQACEARGWTLAHVYREVESGKSRNGRPKLKAALEQLQAGAAQALVVAKLDRLARSTLDFAEIVAQARAEGWTLVILDPAIDLASPHGRMIAGILASLAEWERELISQRTKEGLAQARERGSRMGPPDSRRIPPELRERILAMRQRDRMSFRAIALTLTEEGVPTATGAAKWAPETVRQAVLAAL
jgi:DNA invertase Pin-like site-specific DNA recombinase